MKKAPRKKKRGDGNGLRKEYDLKALGPGVRGKYYERYVEGAYLVPLDPDIAVVFPSAKDVNDALRFLVTVASKSVRPARRGKKSQNHA